MVCRTSVKVLDRSYVRTEYFIRAAECPEDYHSVLAAYKAGGHRHRAGAVAAAGQAATADEQQQQQQGTVGSASALTPSIARAAPAGLLPIGVTCYSQLFTGAELQSIEAGSGKGGGSDQAS